MVKSKDGTRFPRIPKGSLSFDQVRKIEQDIANYNWLNPLTPTQVRKANRIVRLRRTFG